MSATARLADPMRLVARELIADELAVFDQRPGVCLFAVIVEAARGQRARCRLLGDDVNQLATDLKLTAASSQNLTIYDIGIAEVVLMHSARLCGKSIKDSGVRRMYNVNVLGVQRGGDCGQGEPQQARQAVAQERFGYESLSSGQEMAVRAV